MEKAGFKAGDKVKYKGEKGYTITHVYGVSSIDGDYTDEYIYSVQESDYSLLARYEQLEHDCSIFDDIFALRLLMLQGNRHFYLTL